MKTDGMDGQRCEQCLYLHKNYFECLIFKCSIFYELTQTKTEMWLLHTYHVGILGSHHVKLHTKKVPLLRLRSSIERGCRDGWWVKWSAPIPSPHVRKTDMVYSCFPTMGQQRWVDLQTLQLPRLLNWWAPG